MDSVRFGRVLGTGARLAGRTLAAAVEAAVAPNPSEPREVGSDAPPPRPPTGVVLPPVREAVRQVQEGRRNVRAGSRRFGEAVWGPVARASGVLWLEVTGVFFGLLALFGLQGVWASREAWRNGPGLEAAHRHLLLSAAITVVFGYFCATSFLKASKRGRRR